MSANYTIQRCSRPPFALLRRRPGSGSRRMRSSLIHPCAIEPAAIGRCRLSPGLVNCFFCASLWLSLILAIWMGRGWIALLLSGQLLSAGASLIQKLTHKTHYAFAKCGASPARGEEQRRG